MWAYNATRFIDVSEASMFFTCTINVCSETTDSYADITKTYISGSPVKCGFMANSGGKKYGETEVLSFGEVLFRLPLSTAVTIKDTITYDDDTYHILNISKGSTCLLVKCQKLGV